MDRGERMDGWMGGWRIDVWTDEGWVEDRMDEWIDEQMENGWMDKQMVGWMDGWVDGGRRMDGWLDGGWMGGGDCYCDLALAA